MNKNNYILLFCIAVLIRLVYFFVFKIDSPLNGDEMGYLRNAHSIFTLTPEITRPPLLPYLLAPFEFFGNYNIILARLIGVLISSLTVLIIIFVAEDLFIKHLHKFSISLFVCFYPPSIFYSPLILTETLSAFFICLIIFLTQKYTKTNQKIFLLCIGFSFGLLALTRSSYLYIILLFLIALLLQNKKSIKNNFLFIISILLPFSFVLTPQILYNYKTFKIISASEPRLGYGLYICNNDFRNTDIKSGGYYKDERIINFSDEMKFDPINIIKRDNDLKILAIDNISKNYHLLPRIIANRIINFWTFRPNPYKKTITKTDIAMFFIWSPILIGYFCSFIFYRHKFTFLIFDLFIFYSLLTVIPFWGIPRFRFPVDFLIIIKSLYFYFNIQFHKERK